MTTRFPVGCSSPWLWPISAPFAAPARQSVQLVPGGQTETRCRDAWAAPAGLMWPYPLACRANADQVYQNCETSDASQVSQARALGRTATAPVGHPGTPGSGRPCRPIACGFGGVTTAIFAAHHCVSVFHALAHRSPDWRIPWSAAVVQHRLWRRDEASRRSRGLVSCEGIPRYPGRR